jgi:hypothetical protein
VLERARRLYALAIANAAGIDVLHAKPKATLGAALAAPNAVRSAGMRDRRCPADRSRRPQR